MNIFGCEEEIELKQENVEKSKRYENRIASNVKINGKFKDRLFRFRFGSEEYKEEMLLIYNALNNTSYSNPDDITITTIGDVIYIKMKNDVSFLLDGNIPLWEQQSTINPNMPVRGFMYFGELYSQYITTNELNIYGEELKKIPTPQYIVFYNGIKDYDAVKKLKLSDAFINPDKSGDFEWTATVYNLNRGKNDELLKKCKPLSDYMEFVNRVNDNKKSGMGIEESVDNAVNSCIKDGIMKEFLIKHRAEVKAMCITEFNEKVYEDGIREEGRKEGREEGRKEGREEGIQVIVNMCQEFGLSVTSAKQRLITEYTLSPADAELKIKKYWKE